MSISYAFTVLSHEVEMSALGSKSEVATIWSDVRSAPDIARKADIE
jgi:hypothetical protein